MALTGREKGSLTNTYYDVVFGSNHFDFICVSWFLQLGAMSPKSKKTTAKAKAAPTKAAGTKKTVKSASMTKQEAKQDRDSEIKTVRSMKKFTGFGHKQFHGIKRDGVCLYQAIKNHYDAGNKRLSPGQVLALRTKYQGGEDGDGFNFQPKELHVNNTTSTS